MNLAEAATVAVAKEREQGKAQAAAYRQAALETMRKRWAGAWDSVVRNSDQVTAPPFPEDPIWGTVLSDSDRHSSHHGWLFEIDGIKFMWSTDYSSGGLCAVVTCPDCGQERAVHFYGLADLGKKIKAGRDPVFHKCLEIELRYVAAAIRSAATSLDRSEQDVAELALDRIRRRQ